MSDYDTIKGFDSRCGGYLLTGTGYTSARFYNAIPRNGTYSVSFYARCGDNIPEISIDLCDNLCNKSVYLKYNEWVLCKFENITVNNFTSDLFNFLDITINYPESSHYWHIELSHICINEGTIALPWTPHPSEIYDGITTVDKDGVKVSHNNGDYTQLHAEGLKRYRSNGDAKGDYHYLTQYVGFSGQDTVWVQLKDDFKGKHFTAYSVISDTWEDSWNHGDPWVMQRFVTYVQTDMIDYANARVPILIYRIDKNYKTGEHRKKPCAGVLLVVA